MTKPGVLRVGDRVSVNGWLAGGSYCNGHPGVVEREVRLPDRLEVRMDFDGGIYQVHPKQCRKLRPAKRRRVWVSASALNKGFAEFDTTVVQFKAPEVEDPAWDDWIEFREVKRK